MNQNVGELSIEKHYNFK